MDWMHAIRNRRKAREKRRGVYFPFLENSYVYSGGEREAEKGK